MSIFKVHFQQVDGCSSFRQFLSALQSPIYNLAKFLGPISNALTKDKYTVKGLFQFDEKTCEQEPSLFMGNLDVDSPFINISLDETINISVHQLVKNIDTVESFTKLEVKRLLDLATNEFYLTFCDLQIECTHLLVTSPGNAFRSYPEKGCLNVCRQGLKPVIYQRYIDEFFFLFKLNDLFQYFRDFLNSSHISMPFSSESEKENTLHYLDVIFYVNKVNLQTQFVENLPLGVYTVTLNNFYLLLINLVQYIPGYNLQMPYHSFRLELSLCRVNFFEENILQIHLLKENATEVKKRLLQVL